jgi:hypothetical protein
MPLIGGSFKQHHCRLMLLRLCSESVFDILKTVVVIAGLPVEMHDRVRKESSKRFAPDGFLSLKPVQWPGYKVKQADDYINEVGGYVSSLPEDTEVAVLLAYVDYGDPSTNTFVARFFPFALARALMPLDLSDVEGNKGFKERLNTYLDYLDAQIAALRERARVVREHTNVHNLTPLLLPLRNFRSDQFPPLLENLFNNLGSHPEPKELLKEVVSDFFAAHPRTTPDGDDRHCFSDGVLYFKSPGKHRHGFYRHSKNTSHGLTCLLNARSRLGGTYDYKLHYDCTPTRGSLNGHYPNCHGEDTQPKTTHVNIAPNDAVI